MNNHLITRMETGNILFVLLSIFEEVVSIMKKRIFAVVALLIVVMLNSVVYAKMVPVADCGTEKCVMRMQNIINGNMGLKNVLMITKCNRENTLDISKEHLYAWSCEYGFKQSNTPDGNLILWADDSGYVKHIKMVHNVPDLKNSSFTMMKNIILQAVGLNPTEIENSDKSYKKYSHHYVSTVWCNSRRCQYAIMLYPRIRVNNPSVSDFGVLISANDDVNEVLSASQELLTYE